MPTPDLQQNLGGSDLLHRRAPIAPRSVNDKNRTVRVTFSTGAAVRRRDLDGPYWERLSLDPAHVQVDALIGGPVLNGHRAGDLSNVLGVVTEAGTDGREGWAELKFSRRPDVEPIWQDVAAGILRSVSVGYSVDRWAESTNAAGERVRTAIRWTPREISFVPLPADAGATVRGENMPESITAPQHQPAREPAPATEPTQATRNAPADPAPRHQPAPATEGRAEINREIRTIAATAGLEAAWADDLIDRGASVQEARAAAYEAMTRRSAEPVQHHRVSLIADHDAPDARVERMTEALVCRMAPALVENPSEASRPYMQRSLIDMAAELLQLRGVRTGMMSRDQILERALAGHGTSDFPVLLQQTGNRVLMASFQSAASPLRRLGRQTTANDFRAKTTAKLGPIGALPKVNEHGEVQHVTRAEAKETYRLETYAAIFSLTRQAIINDDLGAFTDWSLAAGRGAAETEATVLAGLLTANGGLGITLDDGNPLYDAAHGNIAAAGAALSVDTLSEGRQAMREQTDLDGKTPINAAPRFLLVGPENETAAEKVLAQLAPSTVDEVNPFSGRLDLAVEARLPGPAWRLFADPATLPVIEWAYLSSAQGPQIASREGWNVLGMEFRVHLDFGAGIVDHRGTFLNEGA
jgi:hypothetical protein